MELVVAGHDWDEKPMASNDLRGIKVSCMPSEGRPMKW